MKSRKLLMWSGVLAAISPDYALGVQTVDGSGWYLGFGVGRSDATRRTTSWGQQTDATLRANGGRRQYPGRQ
jgi:hypothetical protein